MFCLLLLQQFLTIKPSSFRVTFLHTHTHSHSFKLSLYLIRFDSMSISMSILMFNDFESPISVLGVWRPHVCPKKFVFNVLLNLSFYCHIWICPFHISEDLYFVSWLCIQFVIKLIMSLPDLDQPERFMCSKSFVFNVLFNLSVSCYLCIRTFSYFWWPLFCLMILYSICYKINHFLARSGLAHFQASKQAYAMWASIFLSD